MDWSYGWPELEMATGWGRFGLKRLGVEAPVGFAGLVEAWERCVWAAAAGQEELVREVISRRVVRRKGRVVSLHPVPVPLRADVRRAVRDPLWVEASPEVCFGRVNLLGVPLEEIFERLGAGEEAGEVARRFHLPARMVRFAAGRWKGWWQKRLPIL